MTASISQQPSANAKKGIELKRQPHVKQTIAWQPNTEYFVLAVLFNEAGEWMQTHLKGSAIARDFPPMTPNGTVNLMYKFRDLAIETPGVYKLRIKCCTQLRSEAKPTITQELETECIRVV